MYNPVSIVSILLFNHLDADLLFFNWALGLLLLADICNRQGTKWTTQNTRLNLRELVFPGRLIEGEIEGDLDRFHFLGHLSYKFSN